MTSRGSLGSVLAATSLLFASACGAGGGDGGGDPLPDTVADLTTTTEGDDRDVDAVDLAEEAALALDDLPANWLECCPPLTYDQESLARHTCGSPDGLPPRAAGYQRQYARTVASGPSDAFVIGSAIVAADEDAATREFTATESPERERCKIESVERTTAETHGGPVANFETTYEPGSIALDVPAVLSRLYTTFDIDGERGWLHYAVVDMRVGRLLLRVSFRSYTDPIDDGTITRTARALADRLLDP